MTINIKGFDVLIDDEDFEKVSKYKWSRTGYNGPYFTAHSHMDNGIKKHIILHRFIMGCSAGDGYFVDHTSGDTLDNRKINLRKCNKAENCRNQKTKSSNTSGYKGVSWHNVSKKWSAQICITKEKGKHKIKWIGLYDTKELAHAAYCKAAKELHGEFARFK